MREPLKPCPFCGSMNVKLSGSFMPSVNCNDCQCDGGSGRNNQEAIARWNRRKPGPVTEALVTAFASACPSYLSDCSEVQLTLKAEDIRRFMAEVFVEGGEDA